MDQGEKSYRRFLNGDWEGLREIIDEYYDGLVAYLNRYLRNLDDAEDMAEETILTLTTRRPTFRGEASFKTWLYGIGRNQTCAYLRENHRTVVVSPEDLNETAATQESAMDGLVREENQKLVRTAMERLPEEYWQILALRYYDEWSVSEIATAFGKSRHSVNGTLRRAKKALKQELKQEGFDHEIA
ncbi:MAG: sigma-70 family RNA polymerase sigma factor [Lachnospiraceae bacterium]|nr:sigma-70 family RNA polymerase sigma factor [Lachnospiraceae bacterium]